MMLPRLPLRFGRIYHLYHHAAQPIFTRSDDYATFLQQVATLITPVADIYAYCLLPDHAHFLVGVKPLAAQAARPLSATAQFDQLFSPFGADNFKQYEVESRAERTALVVYLHRNPQTHGAAPDFRQWKWSSYQALSGGGATQVQREAVWEWFFGRKWFDDAHWQPLDESRICHLIRDEWSEPRP
jgi:hypothetical protein